MRQIKFRGKRKIKPKYEDEWAYGGVFVDAIGETFIVNGMGSEIKHPNTERERRLEEVVDVIPETVGQFTGLLDKNGREIYEGDWLKDDTGDYGIVRFGKLPLNKSGDCVCRYLAFYVECKGQLGQAPMYDCENIGEWMEVIGNIHDNPELLEKDSS